jgi:hypothetical protein
LDSSNSRLLHCTISYFALQRKSHSIGRGATSCDPCDGALGHPKRQCAQSLTRARPINMQRAT